MLGRKKCRQGVILMSGVVKATTLFIKDAETIKKGREKLIADCI